MVDWLNRSMPTSTPTKRSLPWMIGTLTTITGEPPGPSFTAFENTTLEAGLLSNPRKKGRVDQILAHYLRSRRFGCNDAAKVVKHNNTAVKQPLWDQRRLPQRLSLLLSIGTDHLRGSGQIDEGVWKIYKLFPNTGSGQPCNVVFGFYCQRGHGTLIVEEDP